VLWRILYHALYLSTGTLASYGPYALLFGFKKCLGWGLDDRKFGLNSWKGDSDFPRNGGLIPGTSKTFLPFQKHSDRLCCPLSLFPMAIGAVSPWVKRPGREADHWISYSAEIKNELRCTSTPPMHSWRGWGQLCLQPPNGPQIRPT
jgi:hypothetical protein